MGKCKTCGEWPLIFDCAECGKRHITVSYWDYLGVKEGIKEVKSLQGQLGKCEKEIRSLKKEKKKLLKLLEEAHPGEWGICEHCGRIDMIGHNHLRKTKDGLFHHHCYQQVCKNKKRGRGVISA